MNFLNTIMGISSIQQYIVKVVVIFLCYLIYVFITSVYTVTKTKKDDDTNNVYIINIITALMTGIILVSALLSFIYIRNM